jgi:S-ribosylhomocysteine lyase LuxS involved in autoinducer biosynthesis
MDMLERFNMVDYKPVGSRIGYVLMLNGAAVS